MMFQDIKDFNCERLKDRVHQSASFQMNDNKSIVSILCFHNSFKMRAPCKTKNK